MALAKTGAGITDIKGSIAGNIFTRDASGLHCNAKGRTVRGGSILQFKRRKAYSKCVNFWKSSVSAPERELWQLYAHHHPTKNAIAQQITLSAFSSFLSINIYRAYNEVSLIAEPPPD